VKNGCPGLSQKQTRSALLRLGIKPASFDIEKFWFDLDKTGKSNNDSIIKSKTSDFAL
jgi:hypothetical protein